jgi:hypothetical protein
VNQRIRAEAGACWVTNEMVRTEFISLLVVLDPLGGWGTADALFPFVV